LSLCFLFLLSFLLLYELVIGQLFNFLKKRYIYILGFSSYFFMLFCFPPSMLLFDIMVEYSHYFQTCDKNLGCRSVVKLISTLYNELMKFNGEVIKKLLLDMLFLLLLVLE
jgi:hypothetical protein